MIEDVKVPRASQFVTDAMRSEITNMLSECTDEQNAFLHKIHDGAPWRGLSNCPADRLKETFDLVARTVEKNRQ